MLFTLEKVMFSQEKKALAEVESLTSGLKEGGSKEQEVHG